MTNETRAALAHFFANEGKPVAEALEAEVARIDPRFVQRDCAAHSVAGTEMWREWISSEWRNDRWQAAWPEKSSFGKYDGLMYSAIKSDGAACFWMATDDDFVSVLTGDELAAALRDLALGEQQ